MGKIRDEINKIEEQRKVFDHYCVIRQKYLQNKCKHDPEYVNFHADPSGNNDSFWDCIECGSYFKNFPGEKK